MSVQSLQMRTGHVPSLLLTLPEAEPFGDDVVTACDSKWSGSVVGVQSIKEVVDVEHATFSTGWDVPAGAATIQVEVGVNDPSAKVFGDDIHPDAVDAARETNKEICDSLVDMGAGFKSWTQIRTCGCVGGGGIQVPTTRFASDECGLELPDVEDLFDIETVEEGVIANGGEDVCPLVDGAFVCEPRTFREVAAEGIVRVTTLQDSGTCDAPSNCTVFSTRTIACEGGGCDWWMEQLGVTLPCVAVLQTEFEPER